VREQPRAEIAAHAGNSACNPTSYAQPKQHPATKGLVMALRLLGGDTGDGGSPRLYQDGKDYLVQGYVVTDPRLLAQLRLPDGEAAVRVPQSLWNYLPAGPRMKRAPEGSSGLVLAGCGRDACRLAAPRWHGAEEEEQMASWPMRPSGPAGDWAPSIAVGDQVRWLMHRWASALTFPADDLRVIDGSGVIAGLFTGDGIWAGSEGTGDTALARQCQSAFAARRAIFAQHTRYGPDLQHPRYSPG
jgi:uncharacterized protein DUF6879